MIVAGHLIGQRQRRGIEDAGFTTEESQQAGRLLDAQPRIGAFPQATIEQQDTRRRIARAQPERGPVERLAPVECRQMIGIGKRAERHYRLSLMARAASVTSRTGIVSVAPTRK